MKSCTVYTNLGDTQHALQQEDVMGLFEVKRQSIDDKSILKKTNQIQKGTRKAKANKVLDVIARIVADVEKNLGKYKNEYTVVNTKEQLQIYLDGIFNCGVVAIDTETTGLDPIDDTIAGFSLYVPEMKGGYCPINHISNVTGKRLNGQLDIEDAKWLFDELSKYELEIVMFNAAFDIRVIRNMIGAKDIYCTWDCYLAARLLNENEEASGLKPLWKKYCSNGEEDAFRFGDLFKNIPFTEIPYDVGYLYAAHDAHITYKLYLYQRQFLVETEKKCKEHNLQSVAWVFHNIEMPCVDAVCNMEDTGVTFDFDYNQKLKDKYHALLEEREEAFHEMCRAHKKEIFAYRKKYGKLDEPISIKSSTQLAILLYDIIGLEPLVDRYTKKPLRSTKEDILRKLNHPIADAILDYREFSTIVSTFIDTLPTWVKDDGKIHCKFNQYGARTGRFSSESPNMQNIPSHNKDIRKMFTASDGYVLMSADYSQQEPKAMTQMCGDKKMLDAYKHGKDLYAEIAAVSFDLPYEECLEHFPKGAYIKETKNGWVYGTKNDYDKIADGVNDTYSIGKERRSQAKSIFLGVLYGRGVNSIAEQLGTTKQKAQQISDSVSKKFPAIPKFEKDSLKMARDVGYVTTLWGRKRRLPDLQLPEYEFVWKDGRPPEEDFLDFDIEDEIPEVPSDKVSYYLKKLRNAWGKEKRVIFEEANEEGIWIIDNGGKIAEAKRRCVNSRIQGTAADMTKLAMILIHNDEKLRKWGFRLLLQVHDELIGECPMETAKKCKKRFAKLMAQAAEEKFDIPISCDVAVSKKWCGKEVEV